jgi:hypothetical protein
MRRFFCLILLLAVNASALASDVTFARVWPQWRNADAFDRIREYFGGPENDGREIVVRTHPEQRAGLYFLVRVQSAAATADGKFVLEVIRPDSPEVKTFTFPVSLPGKNQVAELGLTDGDWPGGRDVHPVAWRLTLVDHSGQSIASGQSFLWQKPGQ